jgi:cobalt-zinc-cadmium efflux system outer membrane protein
MSAMSRFVFVLALVTCPAAAAAAPNPLTAEPTSANTTTSQKLTLETFLAAVARENVPLAAKRLDIDVADAQISIAKIFPDPQVTAGLLQYDVTKQGNPTATILQLAVPVQIGGQRGARVAVAEAGTQVARADFEDALRNLRADAADAFVDALYARLLRARKQRTLASLTKLVVVNEERLRAGDVGEATVIQSRVEANRFRAGELEAEGLVRIRDAALRGFLGRTSIAEEQAPLLLEGDLEKAAQSQFSAVDLTPKALQIRPDLQRAKQRKTQADAALALADRNRVVDVTLGATWQHNFAVHSGPAPFPASDFLGGTVTVPIPFSRLRRGEVAAASATAQQAAWTVEGAEIGAVTELRQAVAAHDAAAARVRLFTGGVLADADKVLEKTLFNYQRGGATLVEVLVAQRTVDEVYIDFYDALAAAGHAAVAVERASGTQSPPPF